MQMMSAPRDKCMQLIFRLPNPAALHLPIFFAVSFDSQVSSSLPPPPSLFPFFSLPPSLPQRVATHTYGCGGTQE